MKNKIQYIISALALNFIVSYTANAQVTSQKIGNNPTTISPNAVLEMESATKGVLFPRVALTSITDVTTVPSPTNGLTVFNTATDGTAPNNVSFGYYYWSATASKWVKLAVETPPIEFAKTVYVNSMSPNTATIFDETNPATTNNSTLAAAVANLYIGNDGSTWTYDNANSTYKTYAVAPSTPFYLANTTNDAGNNKTGSIWRTGNIGIGINNPASNLHVHNALPATATVNANAQVLRLSRPTTTDLKWDNIAQFNLGSYSTAIAANTRLDLALTNGGNAVDFTNVMTWQANGNVGIRNTAPTATLDVNSSTIATQTINADVTVLKLARPLNNGLKFPNIALFNLGSHTTGGQANTRLDLNLSNINDTDLPNVMTWQANGNVGIGNTAPNAPLVVQGRTKDTGVLKLVGPLSPLANDTWWMGFGHGTSSGDDNDRARIGVDIATGGDGRLFFTTGKNNAQKRAVFIDENQRVGIGTSAPAAQLEVATTGTAAIFRRGNTSLGASNIWLQRTQNTDPNVHTAGSSAYDVIGKLIFSMANGTTSASYPTNGNASIGAYYVNSQTTGNAGGGLTFSTVLSGNTAATERLRIEHNGNVGIGNYGTTYTSATEPRSKLEVDGSSTNKTSFNAGTSTTIDFSKSNLAYTDANPGPFTINNIKDGGTYTLAVRGTTIGTSVFTFPGFSIQKGPGIAATTVSGKETLYTFLVIGDRVYVYMTAGI